MSLRRQLFAAVLAAGGIAAVAGVPSAGAMTGGRAVSAAVAITAAPAFTSSDLSATPGADWIANGGSINNQRYSSLNQISASNVAGIKEAWHIHLNGSGVAAKYSAEANALVYKGVMYITPL